MEHANDIAMLLGNFGFPILVSVYLLVRFEQKIGELTEKVNSMARIVEQKMNNR
ncbi:YvrJ family protein [Lentibacillus sediminis]|uniref:YvrJ family protein n=1 Tax=Lentibacillus sediminis TaxID=1940529 RepID=UPI000C1C78AF|nr:YvrJ family protein [Lentibacillus sediminis]